MTTDRYVDYDPFAWLYNKYWGGEFVQTVLPVLDQHVFEALDSAAKILDIGCGTGHLAANLTGRGFHVTGVDGSEEMLQYARHNAPIAEFIASDARELQLPNEYHAAVSTYDSLNHIMSLEDLQRVFENVNTALLAGGSFMFDLNMKAGYEARWQGTFNIIEDDHVAVTRSSFDALDLLGTVDITIFRLEKGEWSRSDVSLSQRCYTEGEVRAALARAGFDAIEVLDSEKDLGFVRQIGRSFFVAVKTDHSQEGEV